MMYRLTKILIALIVTQFAMNFGYAETTKEADNKKLVTTFYDIAINQKDADAALKYLGNQYIQHNPLAADGAEGLRAYIQFLKTNFPAAHSEIKHVYAEGDFVLLHVHAVLQPDTRGSAVVDIFRLDHGKIVEHWDVIQEIPEKSANDNGMF